MTVEVINTYKIKLDFPCINKTMSNVNKYDFKLRNGLIYLNMVHFFWFQIFKRKEMVITETTSGGTGSSSWMERILGLFKRNYASILSLWCPRVEVIIEIELVLLFLYMYEIGTGAMDPGSGSVSSAHCSLGIEIKVLCIYSNILLPSFLFLQICGSGSQTFDNCWWCYNATHTGTSQERLYLLFKHSFWRCLSLPGKLISAQLNHDL